ncbi:MAG: hypothetical protein GY845_23325 [Planctomycetes bacterium]|nr:hypothetical protein [Planctomycetota bacterium]
MIKFNCKKCGQKFDVPETRAGQKGKCTKCKNIVIVPDLESINPKYSDYDLSLLDIPQKNETQNQQDSQHETSGKVIEKPQEFEEEPAEGKNESISKRQLPWLVDILLYPTSQGGLSTIVLVFLLRLSIDILTLFLICCVFGGILGLIAKILIVYSYMYWYFSECIRDSAAGGIRAPEIKGNISSLEEMFWQLVKLFACYTFTLGPASFYRGYTYFHEIEMNRIILWSLLTYGMFFFPMAVLAFIMLDSVKGLNPVLLIRSIISTRVQYCGLVILFYVFGILFYILRTLTVSLLPKIGIFSYILLAYITFNIFTFYSLLILGHLLGRFYWKYQEKLNWEV